MIQSVLYVALGGALGSAARFVVSRLVQEHVSTPFPLPTMAVNIVGCLLIGLVYGFAARHEGLGDGMKLFLTVGFCVSVSAMLVYTRQKKYRSSFYS